MTPLRWVLDTNVLLSALLFAAGRVTWVRDAWRTGTITPLASRDTTTELIRVLGYPKFGLTAPEREDLLGDYLTHAETVVMSHAPAVPECRDPCRDPFDRAFLELALAGGADALVTGDQDLLVLATAFEVPIVTPNEARTHLTRRPTG